jgi:hypothetical protein
VILITVCSCLEWCAGIAGFTFRISQLSPVFNVAGEIVSVLFALLLQNSGSSLSEAKYVIGLFPPPLQQHWL